MFEIAPWMIDAILLLIVAEFFYLRSWLVKMNAKRFVTPLFLFLLSGGLLMFAIRLALSNANMVLISLDLLLAFICHIATLLTAAKEFLPDQKIFK
ncbi:MAG: hypothetical protein AAGD92_12355 [Pseudomonadota bacterium]